MKKIILVVLSAVMALSITGMTACGDGKEYSVTFDKNCYAEAIVPSGLTVKGGGKITEPETPSREGYSFTGWYSDASLTEKWDFMKDAVKKETVLYAGWMKSGVTDKISYPDTDKDLSNVVYNGIIFTDSTGKYMNLECSDTFKVGDKWYLTYSAQDDTMFYASSDNEYGPYDEPKILDGKLFYAAKHVSDGTDTYLVGWARRSESVSSTQDVSGWAGNMIAQKVVSDGNGGIYLAPVDYSSLLKTRRALAVNSTSVVLESGSRISYTDAFNCYERYIVEGDLSFTNGGEFGFAFDYNGTENKYKTIYINPAKGVIGLAFNKGSTVITEIPVSLSAKKEYSFKYMQEGSVGVFYIDGKVALTVRLYGCTGKNVKLFASNNNVTLSSVTIYT